VKNKVVAGALALAVSGVCFLMPSEAQAAATARAVVSEREATFAAAKPESAGLYAYAAKSFATVGSGVNVRGCASTGCGSYATLPLGYTWIVQCYVTGSSVNGDTVWYYGSNGGLSGYVAGYWLNTGHDPNAGVARC
jgi:hypothetical protein